MGASDKIQRGSLIERYKRKYNIPDEVIITEKMIFKH